MTPEAAFHDQLAELKLKAGSVIGVAVSGGSDSMALLALTHRFAQTCDITVTVATVDHGLRFEAAEEAEQVASFCQDRGMPHSTLRWRDWDQNGNVQSAAREARYALLSQWAADVGATKVLLGHTKDDQAETVLMALARGSGVDGLAGMRRHKDNLYYRPLLDVTREDLRCFLRDAGIRWVDDPSNADDRYNRVKARKLLAQLSDLGLTTDRLVQTAGHMQRARSSLTTSAFVFEQVNVVQHGPDLILENSVLDIDQDDTMPRVFASAIMWVTGATYRPRFHALRDVAAAVKAGETRTLHGALILAHRGQVRIMREHAACTEVLTSRGGETSLKWDSRWIVSCGDDAQKWPADLMIKALGKAVSGIENWRDAGLPYASAIATPGVFKGESLISAPAVGFSAGFSARFVADFHTSPLFH